MMNINLPPFTKKVLSVFITFITLAFITLFSPRISHASPRLYFDPDSISSSSSEIPVKIQIDAENNKAFGADATIIYSTEDLILKSVFNGNFFSDFTYAHSQGRIEIHAYFSNLYESKTGSGTFADLVFIPSKASADTQLNFYCTNSADTSQILNEAGKNILSCGQLNTLNLSYSDSRDINSNSCGGTCGSNFNCKSDLYCYEGYCRNPNCPTQNDCNCISTPTPTPTGKATTKPKSTLKPTPEIVVLTTNKPINTQTPISSIEPQENEVENNSNITAKIIALGSVLAVILITTLIVIKKRSNIPKIYNSDNPPQI